MHSRSPINTVRGATRDLDPLPPNSGSVLFMTMGVMFLLLALGATAFLRGTFDLRAAGFYTQDAQALFHAEAGAQYVFSKITNDVENGTLELDLANETVSYSAPSGYNFDPVTNLTRLADGKRYLLNVSGRAGEAEVAVEAVLQSKAGNNYALEAGEYIRFESGSYGTGDIRCNEGIDTSGTITGNARPGPGYNVSDPSDVTGSTLPATSTFTLDPVDAGDLASAAAANNNAAVAPYFDGSDFRVNGASMTMPPGTYCFDQVELDSSATVTITGGVVTIYATGTVHVLNGSDFNPSGTADQLWIYATTSGNLSLNGGGDLTGHLYAPNANEFYIDDSSVLTGSASVGGYIRLNDSGNFVKAGAIVNGVHKMYSWKQAY